MNRNDTSRKPLGIYRNWKLRMFESLKGKDSDLSGEIVNYDLNQVLNTEKIIDFELLLPEIVENALNTLRYQSYLCDQQRITDHLTTIQQFLTENDEIKQLCKNKIYKIIEKNLKLRQEKWTKSIFFDNTILLDAISAKDGLKLFVKKYLLTEYTKLVYLLEKKCSLYSLLHSTEMNKNI